MELFKIAFIPIENRVVKTNKKAETHNMVPFSHHNSLKGHESISVNLMKEKEKLQILPLTMIDVQLKLS